MLLGEIIHNLRPRVDESTSRVVVYSVEQAAVAAK